VEIYKQLDLWCGCLVVSAYCTNAFFGSLIDLIQAKCGIPVTSAAVCTTYEMMKKLNLETKSAVWWWIEMGSSQ
jgi:maleate isomerase